LKNLSGGIDIGSEQHHVIIINDEEKVLYDRKVAHKMSEFRKAIEEFREIEAREEMKISFAIEGKNGYGSPFDRILIERGFTLYNVDNLKLRKFREVFGAEWRNDRRDAKMLAKMVKIRDQVESDRDKVFIEVEKTPLVNERLKILSRHQQSLINEKVHIENRLRKRLLEICPDILEFGDTGSKKLLRVLIKHPDFRRYKRLTMGGLMKIKSIGGEEELRQAFLDNHPHKKSVEKGYPYLIKAGKELVDQGVNFHDLTMVFANKVEPIYHDTCCHFNKTGNEILGAVIGQAIVGEFAHEEE